MEFSQSSTSVSYRRKITIALVVFIATLVVLGGGMFATIHDPSVMFLQDEAVAKWIVPDYFFSLGASPGKKYLAPFRTQFTVTHAPAEAVLVVKAMRACEIRLDGRVLFEHDSNFDSWKKAREVNLTPYLGPGRHVLEIIVFNERGPTAVMARCEAIGLYTDSSWEFTNDGRTWNPVRLASDPSPVIGLSHEFPHVSLAFMRTLPLLGVVFFLVGAWSHYRRRNERFVLSAGMWRWILIVACGILGVNNMFKLDMRVGFDLSSHYEYIQFIAENWRLPYAGDGLQTFQAPLFYGVAAVFQTVSSWFFEPSTVARLLRIVPLACGMAQVELCYRVLRTVYPDRADVQIVGTTFGALLPMNLYISQVVGNEPMSGLFGGLVCLLLISMVCGKFSEGRKSLVLLGAALGAALLSKATALLLLPITLAAFVYRAVKRNDRLQRVAVSLSIVFGTAGIISAWYYIRNFLRFNSFFVGGWDPVIGIEWWQHPGYRMIDQYLHFGQALTFPVFSATAGFWDGLYSTFWADGYLSGSASFDAKPPWNYSSMLSGVWLAFIPIAAMATCMVGAGWSLLRKQIPHDDAGRSRLMAQIFSIGCVAIYFAAILYLHTRVPFYSGAKATYTTGILPCYAILVAGGFRFLRPQSIVWTVCVGLFACWAFAAYSAFFVW